MWGVVRPASWPDPPMKATMAGAPAMAKPPMPAVSVIVLSPMSGLASLSLIHISEPTETVLDLVCRLLLEKKKNKNTNNNRHVTITKNK